MTIPIRALRRPRSLPLALLTASVFSATAVIPSFAQATSATASAVAHGLPSGLAPVSQLQVGGSQLALDSNGTLFRLDGHGKQWKQVRQQWDGKAIELLGIPALTSLPRSGQVVREDGDAETYAAVLLKSTAALHWVSLDRGKTWKLSNLDDVRRNDVKWSGD